MGRFRIDNSDIPKAAAGWLPISSTTLDPAVTASDSKKQAIETWKAAQKTVGELLQCDHLMVLTGLGTSLCIKNTDGETLFPTMKVLWDATKSAVGPTAFDAVCAFVNHVAIGNIEELLSRCLMAVELGKPHTNTSTNPDLAAFIKTAEEVIVKKCRQELVADATATHEDFLRRLTRRAPRRPRACVFTTNYDQCFEVAGARIGLTVIDGFSFSAPPRFQPEMFDYDVVTNSTYSKEPDFVPHLLRLFKLHGSVDWHGNAGVIEKRSDTDRPVLIYPQSGKYAASYSPPFLEVMSRFQSMLRQRNVGLLVACCGFNDLHLAEPVLAAVKSNTSLRAVVWAPDLCDIDAQELYKSDDAVGASKTNTVLRQFNQLIDNGDTRLTLINGFFPDLVTLMPMLKNQTDAGHHESRIRELESWMARKNAEQGAIV